MCVELVCRVLEVVCATLRLNSSRLVGRRKRSLTSQRPNLERKFYFWFNVNGNT